MQSALFTSRPTKLDTLLSDIRTGRTALPDLQRPFVWKDSKVRDLLDSMSRGYPIGYVMLWDFPDHYEPAGRQRAICEGDGQAALRSLIIDGQQRLTALLSAMEGITVKDSNYRERRIRIAYSPVRNVFEVWSAAYERDPEWIADIQTVFQAAREQGLSRLRRNFIRDVNESRLRKDLPELSDDEEDRIEENLQGLVALGSYELPTLEIGTAASEEDVAEIFVRVNSGGQQLKEQDFIATLLAVYDNATHERINAFCEAARTPQPGTSYNPIFTPDPAHVIRVAVALGFSRARLRYAYMLMRGKDLETGEVTPEKQTENLTLFREALEKVLDLNNWHGFLNLFPAAGYLTGDLLASKTVVVYCYALYLIGKYRFGVPQQALRAAMTRYIFMATVRYYYSSAYESTFEMQLSDLRRCSSSEDFLAYLDQAVRMQMTDDYFRLTLPSELQTSSSISPIWYAFVAAQHVLGKRLWFGTMPVASLLMPGADGTKKALDKHHIFPKEYLARIGVLEPRDRNQVANYVFLDYQTNIAVSDRPPAEYVAQLRASMSDEDYAKTCEENALPVGFETMDYFDFLAKRRELMASMIREAYENLSPSL